MSMFSSIKETLLENTFLAYKRGLFAGTSGNLSCLDSTGTKIAITPSSYPYEKMTLDDIVIIETSGGAVVEGNHKPSSEWRMHAAIYREVPGTRGVVHIHSPYATALATAGKRIPLVLIETLVYIGGDIPLAEFGLPGTEELGAIVARTLKTRNACLMANHGAVAVGETLEQATLRATYIEDAAKIYLLALQAGGAVALSDADLAAMRKNLGY
ncbi:MAG: class II aldolase/adducin family protein [Spirochaetales bacterium]|nr:class II aldolase/adducin family protein [Spirochaetales bacterium]